MKLLNLLASIALLVSSAILLLYNPFTSGLAAISTGCALCGILNVVLAEGVR